MNNIITKTDFIRYIECPLYAWLLKHKPKLHHKLDKRGVASEGYEVEKYAQKRLEELFPGQCDHQMEAKAELYFAEAIGLALRFMRNC